MAKTPGMIWARFLYTDQEPGPWFKTSLQQAWDRSQELRGTTQDIETLPPGAEPPPSDRRVSSPNH